MTGRSRTAAPFMRPFCPGYERAARKDESATALRPVVDVIRPE